MDDLLSNPHATFEALIAWEPDTRAHDFYADQIDAALKALPPGRKDPASKYARTQLAAERKAVEAELERVVEAMVGVNARRKIAAEAKEKHDAAIVAVARATAADALVHARAQCELTLREARKVLGEYLNSARVAVPRSVANLPLHRGRLRAEDTLDFLRDKEGALDDLEHDRHTHAEASAYDGARAFAGDALAGDVPWVIAHVGDEACRVYRLWLSVVGPRFGFDAPAYDEIFADAEAAE